MEQKSKNGVSIIGGTDGPTSVFIAEHSKKQPLRLRIKNSIYRYKRKKQLAAIFPAGLHFFFVIERYSHPE